MDRQSQIELLELLSELKRISFMKILISHYLLFPSAQNQPLMLTGWRLDDSQPLFRKLHLRPLVHMAVMLSAKYFAHNLDKDI